MSNTVQTTQNTKPAKKPLSDRGIKGMKPGDKPKADTAQHAGLRVQCGKGGTKTFFYRYKSPVTGKLAQYKIGNYPSTSLSEARVELARLKAMRKKGECPRSLELAEKARLEQERIEEVREAQIKEFTVRDLVDLYLEEHIEDRVVSGQQIAGVRKKKGQDETRRTLYNDPVRVLGDRPAAEVTRKDIVELISNIVKRGAPVQAGNVHRELKAAYNFAIDLERFDDGFVSPVLQATPGIKRAFKSKLNPQKRKRVLSETELVQVLRWLPGSGFSTTQKHVLRLTLWTGCRTGELCAAEWRDIDLEKGVFHIRNPKNGVARNAMLPRQAVEYLKVLSTTSSEYVFPSRQTGKPIQQKSLSETKWQLKNPDKVRNRRVYTKEQLWLEEMEDWTPHDLRRTVRTGLASLKCPSDVAETILGHVLPGVEGIYNQYGYTSECREWLQTWADHLDQLLEG